MKTSRFGLGAVALASAVSLTLAGCASSDGGDSGDVNQIITTNGSEPLGPLVTGSPATVNGFS